MLSLLVWLGQTSLCESQINAPPGYIPAAISDGPITVTIDFAQEKGQYPDELFTCMDAPFLDLEMCGLMKESRFKVVATHNRDLTPEKARALADCGFKLLVFFEHDKHAPRADLESKAKAFLDKIDKLESTIQGFKIDYVLIANEPDIGPPPGGFPEQRHPFWTGTMEELLGDYAIVASYLKAQRPGLLVGGLGFADTGSMVWIQKFLDFVRDSRAPLDFLAYHCYSSSIKAYVQGFQRMEDLLQQYPELHSAEKPLRLAVTELDVAACPGGAVKFEYPAGWKAAHNILAMLHLAGRGAWMVIDYGGPSRETADAGSFLWLSSDGTKRPIFYAHQAFNNLAGTIRVAQEGSKFETFGVGAGKSKEGDALVILLASYDQYTKSPPEPLLQSDDALVYKRYNLKVVNLPFSDDDTFVMERYLIDQEHKLALADRSDIQGGAMIEIAGNIDLPQVQLIKIKKK